MDVLGELAEQYPAWWVDLLGEHNHVGGIETTRWLLDRARLRPGDHMLDCGAFVGGAARLAASEGIVVVATDLAPDFLRAGRSLEHGEHVTWVAADTRKLPFRDGTFASVWSLDSSIFPREMSRVAAARATICLCCEVPADGRGGFESLIEEWSAFGWQLSSHRSMTLEALQAWRQAEAQLVMRRPHFEQRYGTRPYLAQLDLLGELVRSYERGGVGHGLFVFERGF
ncbi:MAG: class I SAM-dependent methyltransferase [Hyphomicrobiales bacterium]